MVTARKDRPVGPAYKWIALSNTTMGVLMASIDTSIVLISLPAIFNGIHVNPLAAGETWLAVFGGLIPILGALAVLWIIIRASRNDEDPEE